MTFILEQDQAIFKRLKSEAFEVQVGIHELLGHGSGKLFHAGTPDADALVAARTPHPVTNEPITGPFYAAGSTWDSTFGKVASSYEECRAECCGIFLCLEAVVLEVFGHIAQPDAVGGVHDTAFINWLLMVRAGLTGLEFFTPTTGAWRQAHMQARYVILRVLLEAGEGLVTIQKFVGADGNPDLAVELDRAKIPTVGRKAIGAFLLKLQGYKSLGDLEAGSAMYTGYSEVPAEMQELREIVMARKTPRSVLVQPHMVKGGDGVELVEFESSAAGMIESFRARFPAEDPELMALYHAEKAAVSD